ncbi:MAG: succinylglutamate desuccinylase/aspartoacylase family protein [Methylobacteriaceae bacterium]|nr:succinylglutamate desuccinylase/aspartoacylase family protein [Methylobacteriaceae bacterium]
MTAPERPLESVTFAGYAPGPRLIVLGAVHGDETCGPTAIARVVGDIRDGMLRITRGLVTFVPVANPKAFRLATREGDRNLNRDLREKPLPLDFEDRVGNRLCALLRDHDALLDIHSFKGEGPPFAFYGPDDNDGAREPFAQAAAEHALATRLGVDVLIHGWLETYEKLIAARNRLDLPPLAVTEGYGTTEFMRFAGGYAVTLECGRHDDPVAPAIGETAIRATLAHLRLIDAPAPPPRAATIIHMCETILCEAPGDRLEGVRRTADRIAAGEVIGRRAGGAPVTAPFDGFVIFPNAAAKPGEAICHLGRASQR